jgi:hypothetical protein
MHIMCGHHSHLSAASILEIGPNGPSIVWPSTAHDQAELAEHVAARATYCYICSLLPPLQWGAWQKMALLTCYGWNG